MNTINAVFTSAGKVALSLEWKDAESAGCRDIIPLLWLRDDRPAVTRIHEVIGPRGGKFLAQCRISSQGKMVELDYSAYPKFNANQGMHLGAARLYFKDLKHTQFREVEWREDGTETFEKIEAAVEFKEMDSVAADRSPLPLFSAGRFEQVLAIFQKHHIKQSGLPLDNFRDPAGYVYERENYKTAIPVRAHEELNLTRWKRKQIGDGEILKYVIRAIELHGNNLIRWHGQNGPNSRAHRKLIEALDDQEACKKLEHAFWSLYKLRQPTEEVFNAITDYCGRRYVLLGYLFFLAAPNKYLPIRTTAFDRLAKLLGVSLRTSKSCGWQNYLSYCSVMAEIQSSLIAEGFIETTLLDAHSFCWLTVEALKSESVTIHDEQIDEPIAFGGELKTVKVKQKFTPKDTAAERDMEAESCRKVAAGARAEEVAFESEKQRLVQAGFPQLADMVRSKATQPALGFDIQSVEFDGKTKRFIEVKNISNGRRFHLSINQWLNCQTRDNYWFYLVYIPKKGSPVVEKLSAKNLDESHLSPVEFLVSYEARK